MGQWWPQNIFLGWSVKNLNYSKFNKKLEYIDITKYA